jgi:pimeloyl-ACP methyl ester carboxylesterase
MKWRALAALAACQLLACDTRGADPAPPPDCARLPSAPVLFVHGSGLSSATFQAMTGEFERLGYPRSWLHAVDLVPNDGANERAAKVFLEPAVGTLLRDAAAEARRSACTEPTRVDLVAHSMGSVSARWYAARIGPEKVRTVLGIAPANHGTDALCGLEGSGNRELCPAFAGRGIQFELNGSKKHPRDETPYGIGSDARAAARVPPTAERSILYLTLRIEPDQWIKPEASALLDGAGGVKLPALPTAARETQPGNLLWTAAADHDRLPEETAVIGLVAALLQWQSQP